MTKHIVITGGHHNSALVVAKQLLKLGHKVTWLGHRFAASGDTNDSAEYLEVTSAGIKFYDLKAGKLGSSFRLGNLVKIPTGLLQANRLLSGLKPDIVLSFGGYLGLTTALIAYLRHIPIFLHEQTVVAGKANKLTAKLATRVYLTWDSSRVYFPADKTLLVGLPLRDSILKPLKKKIFDNSLPTILVMGGKQGSHKINNLLFTHLTELLTSYNLVHQTGTSSATHDYQQAITAKDALPPELASHYQPVGYIGEAEIGSYLKSCDLYLGRSGAHTTYELGILGVPSILIPFLYTHSREQLKNAHILTKAGIASILTQSELSYPRLVASIESRLALPRPNSLALPLNATKMLIKDLLHAIQTL